jgi:hypothetical protein
LFEAPKIDPTPEPKISIRVENVQIDTRDVVANVDAKVDRPNAGPINFSDGTDGAERASIDLRAYP